MYVILFTFLGLSLIGLFGIAFSDRIKNKRLIKKIKETNKVVILEEKEAVTNIPLIVNKDFNKVVDITLPSNKQKYRYNKPVDYTTKISQKQSTRSVSLEDDSFDDTIMIGSMIEAVDMIQAPDISPSYDPIPTYQDRNEPIHEYHSAPDISPSYESSVVSAYNDRADIIHEYHSAPDPSPVSTYEYNQDPSPSYDSSSNDFSSSDY